jgi:hypothetical protein
MKTHAVAAQLPITTLCRNFKIIVTTLGSLFPSLLARP